jgi:pSer/pThr/pTyr-binding forkhead associated (FHA) protein
MTIRLSIDTGTGRPTPFAHAGSVVRIGRDPECELSLQGDASSAVSRQHARIELTDAGATLADLGSSNGTLLNGQLLDGPAPLRVGDRIQMGYTGATLTVVELDLAAPSPTKAVAVPRGVLFGGAAVVGAAAAVACVIFLRWPKAPADDGRAPSTEPAVAVRPADTGRPPPPPARDTGRGPAPAVVKGAPSLEVKDVGSYVALDKWVSVLLRRQGEEQPWGVLRPEERVRTAQTLVSLPGYRSLIALDSGLHLTLWGNLPEFSAFPPVLESVVMLNAPAAGTDLDFTLDRGRVVIANRKANAGPARIRLRFLRASWELELPDEKSEVAVELWGLPQQGAATTTCLGLFTKGRVRVKTPRQDLDLGDRSRVSWQNLEPDKPYQTTLPNLPVWWTTPPDRKAPDVEKALRSLLDWRDQLAGPNAGPDKRPALAAAPVVATIKTQVEEVKDPDNQDVGVFFLAALDEVQPLVDCLMDRQNPNVRGATVFALQSWLSRGARHGADLSEILDKRGVGKDKAELIVRLLHFYAPRALDDPKTYEELVNRLDDDNLLVRELSFWQLDRLGVGGRLPPEAKKIVYDPIWDAEKRRSAVGQWKKLVADGKVPATPRR